MSDKPILILQMQRMGDLILSFPLMLWLTRAYPGRRIFVAAEESFFRPLMKISPAVTYFPWEGASVLKEHDYELAVNLSIQEKAAVLAGEVRAEEKLGPVQSADGTRFIHGKWQLYRASLVENNLYNRFHWAELNGLDAIDFETVRSTRPDLPRDLPGGRKIGLFLGASDPAKRPTAELSAAIAKELLGRGLRPILFGGPAEVPLGAEVERLIQGPALNLCGKLGLDEFAAVGQTLSLFVTPDTGPMHLAAWTGLKCLNLSMGHVNPWETAPFGPGHYVLRADMDCARGCWRCTRSRLHCHDPFDPGRIAVLAARLAAGDDHAKLRSLKLPGLSLRRTARGDHGLYHLDAVGRVEVDEERCAARFWHAFFAHRFGVGGQGRVDHAWSQAAEAAPRFAQSLRDHLPEMGRQFTHGLRTRSLLDASFWSRSPAAARPLTGYAQMRLENGDYARAAWAETLELFEALATTCA